MVFPYYPRPEEDVPESEEEQQSEESQPPIPSYLYDVFAYTGEDLSSLYPPKPTPDSGYVAPGESHPLPSGPTTHSEPPIPNDIVALVPPAPTFSGPGYIVPGVTLNPSSESQPTKRSARQAPTSDAGGQGSTVVAPDIEWSPEDEPSGIIPFVQAAAAGTRDGSEDKTTAICEALYAANPEGVARGIKIMRGAELDEEEDSVQELTRILQTIAPRGLFEDEPWYTTKLGSPESLSVSAAEEESLSDQAQAPTEAGNSEAMELNRRLRYSLTESSPNEWDASLTSKEDLETHLLIPKLKRFIHGFDENAVNWDEFTLEESIDFYLRQIAGELRALSENSTVSDEYFQEVQAEYAWAAELQALAKPIALDDTAAYTEVFDVGAEGERAHVQNQLAVIYEYLDITLADDHFESQSTTDLKYELYSLLVYHVIPLRGSDQDPLAAQLFRSYTQAAGVSPQDAVDRLQGTYREPDVLGFLFVMGLTMLVEPLDWALTTVDVINALSEGDIESAVGNFILGVAPFASSRMDDAFRLLDGLGAARLSGQSDNIARHVADAAQATNKVTAPSGSNLVKQADGRFARPGYDATTNLRKQLEYVAEYDPSLAWKAPDPNSDIKEHAHHIVPKGMGQSSQARMILEHHSISLHSHINGVALPEKVHQLTYKHDYARAIDDAMRNMRNASREDVVEFLEEVARRLRKLDPEDKFLASHYRENVLDWIKSHGE